MPSSTPLHELARRGDAAGLEACLAVVGGGGGCVASSSSSSFGLEVPDDDGKTALHVAVQYGHLSCARALLRRGADRDALKRNEWTPLMLACAKTGPGYLALVECLVDEWGCDARLRNKDGWTCFHVACRAGDEEVVRFLLSRDPDAWRTRCNRNRTPLHSAALAGHVRVVELLLRVMKERYGLADVDVEDSCGATPLFEALRGGHVNAARALVDVGGADPRHVDSVLGQNALHVASQAGSLDSVRLLVGAWGLGTPEFLSARTTKFGLAPLHLAVKEGHGAVARVLVEAGADPLEEDSHGRRAADLVGNT